MFRKRWLHVLFVVCMITTTAACSKGNAGKDTAQPPASATAAVTATVAPKPTLKALMPYISGDYNTYPVSKTLEEKTGYKVQYDMLPQDKPSEKLNLLVASGEPYDIINMPGSTDFTALYADYAKRGALTDLTGLIDKYGPNIKASVSQDSFDAVKVNGKIYAIPSKSIETVASGLLIRQDWLDKLGLKAPATTDEFANVLKQFKDKDPGGNGDKNIPFSFYGTSPFMDNLAGAFGIPNGWNDVNGKMTPRILDPGYKDYVAFLKGLLDQGLVDKEFAVNKDATLKGKFTSGKVGVIPLFWFDVPTVADALLKNNPSAKYSYIPELKGPGGKLGTGMGESMNPITVIPKSAAHPEDAIKYINARLDKDVFKNMAIGEEGVDYTFKDGVYSPILPKFTEDRNLANNYLMGVDEKNYPTYWQARVRKDPRLFDAFNILQQIPASAKIPDRMGLAPYMPNYAKTNNQLSTMVNDYTVKLLFGDESMNNLPDFQKKYNDAGGAAAYKEVNDWYATVKK